MATRCADRGRTITATSRTPANLGGDVICKTATSNAQWTSGGPKDCVEHTPTQEEIDRDKKYHWPPPRYCHVPSNRLSVVIDTNSRFSSKESWTETKTLPLHARLPDVMMTFERWAVIDADGKDAARRARQAREEELARQAYTEHALGEHLVAYAMAWEMTKRLRGYLAEMVTRIDDITDDEERATATEWLRWCEEFTASRDPFTRSLRRPQVKPPRYSDLQEFRRRRGFISTY